MTRLLRRLSLVVLAILPSACTFDCSDYTNRTSASGVLRDAANAELAVASIALYEKVDTQNWWMTVDVESAFGSGGAPLRGHVLSARVLSATGEVLVELDPAAPEHFMHSVVGDYVPFASQAAMLGMREAMMSGTLRVAIETDLPGRERLETRLSSTSHVPYVKKECEYYS